MRGQGDKPFAGDEFIDGFVWRPAAPDVLAAAMALVLLERLDLLLFFLLLSQLPFGAFGLVSVQFGV
jgi:hypothetical protein